MPKVIFLPLHFIGGKFTLNFINYRVKRNIVNVKFAMLYVFKTEMTIYACAATYS